jgi:5-oxoprolinase (ATP-hydrolysing) subunit C
LLKFLKKGLSTVYEAKDCLPIYGEQFRGISPKGLMDQGAYTEACTLIGEQANCVEFILAPEIEFSEAGSIVITGAPYQSILLDQEVLSRHKVYHVREGQILRFSQKLKGFRTYLTYMNKIAERASDTRTYLERHPNLDPQGYIRLMKGPEFALIAKPEVILEQGWQVGSQLSSMGMSLTKWGEQLALKDDKQMISSAVADGTIQMTPKGPFILLRHRQTIGGYPRIFNVISADLDRLAQFGPRDFIRFKLLS